MNSFSLHCKHLDYCVPDTEVRSVKVTPVRNSTHGSPDAHGSGECGSRVKTSLAMTLTFQPASHGSVSCKVNFFLCAMSIYVHTNMCILCSMCILCMWNVAPHFLYQWIWAQFDSKDDDSICSPLNTKKVFERSVFNDLHV